MRKARGAVCAAAAKLKDPRARARIPRRKVFISSLHERPAADVEILAHGHVHEAAQVAQRARDVALALHVLREYPHDAHAGGTIGLKDHAPSLAQGLFRLEPRPGNARIIGVRGQAATGAAWALPTFARGQSLPPSSWTTSRRHFATLESKPSLSEEAGRSRICIDAGRKKSRGTRRGIATFTSEGYQDVHTLR